MDWEVIQVVCSLILAGSIAASVYTLYSLSRELTGTLREMRTTLAELRGGSSMKTCSSLVSPGSTKNQHSAVLEKV